MSAPRMFNLRIHSTLSHLRIWTKSWPVVHKTKEPITDKGFKIKKALMQQNCLQGFTLSHNLEVKRTHIRLLPGESHGRRSLVGYSPRGRKESDTTERLHRSAINWEEQLPACGRLKHFKQRVMEMSKIWTWKRDAKERKIRKHSAKGKIHTLWEILCIIHMVRNFVSHQNRRDLLWVMGESVGFFAWILNSPMIHTMR